MNWEVGQEGRHELVSEIDRRGKQLHTVICMETGLVRNDPIPDDEKLAQFYAENYRLAYKGTRQPRRRRVVRYFRRVAEEYQRWRDMLDPAERVLDVGAGSGEFAFLMAQMGKTVTGIEPDVVCAAWCRDQMGLDVRTASLADGLFVPGQFHLIRMSHVLEHLNDPVKYLRLVASWLTTDGVLFIQVPNIEIECRERSVGGIFHFAHIFNFNPWTLRAAAAQAGLAEAVETVERSAGTTDVFFRRTHHPISPRIVENSKNSRKVRELLRRHYNGEFTRPREALKLLTKLARWVEETVTGAVMGSPRIIGNRVAKRLNSGK